MAAADPLVEQEGESSSNSSQSSQCGDHVEVTIETISCPAPETDSPPRHPSPEDTLNGGRKSTRLARALRAGLLRKNQDYVRIKIQRRGNRPSANPLPQEWWKTGVAFVYASACLVLTTGVITMVHERVPSQTPPLPDRFFDLFPHVPAAFTVTEINGMLLVGLFFLQLLFLKHR